MGQLEFDDDPPRGSKQMIGKLPETILHTLRTPPGASGLTVYLANLDRFSEFIGNKSALSVTKLEKSRAESFSEPLLGRRFLLSRHLLRNVLKHHADETDTPVDFALGPAGKPMDLEIPVAFNISHREELLVVAVSEKGEVGIDLERIPDIDTCEACSGLALTDSERIDCFSASGKESLIRFTTLWTLKEAILKQTGEGLSRDMRDIEFRLVGNGWQLKKLPEGYGSVDEWEVAVLEAGLEGVVCAVARMAV